MTKTARIVSKDAAAAAVGQNPAPDVAQLQDRSPAPIPLVAHLIYRLDVGGLENGLVNLINRLPAGRYRHAIICLTGYTGFRQRLRNPAVEIYALHKRAGQDWGLYRRLWRLLRQLKPDILHTRNLAALEGQLPGFLAGIRYRIHSEHGWDVFDVDGTNRRYILLRRLFRPLVHTYIPLSKDLERWLRESIQVAGHKIVQIYNGVDTERFHPAVEVHTVLPDGFAPPGAVVIGTVGRLQSVKDQFTLVQAFLCLLEQGPEARARLRLLIVGEGELRPRLLELLGAANALELAWLPGARDDVPELMRCKDLFVLPSINEGISNTILEAMATGLPVIATNVGGNPELVVDGVTGCLAPPQNPAALAAAIQGYLDDPERRRRHGAAGRQRCESQFSLERMVKDYEVVYDAGLWPAKKDVAASA